MATTIDPGGVASLFAPSGVVGREIVRVTNRVRTEIVRRNKVRTGRMRAGWATRITTRGDQVVGEVYNDVFYTDYHVWGTGIYGPRGVPIRPTTRRFMRFQTSRSGGDWVYAEEVSGIRPDPWVREGLRAGSPWPIVWLGP